MNESASRLTRLVQHIERAAFLDDAARVIKPVANRLTRSDRTKRVLSGAPLGHRAHPLLTDVPIGAWLSASLVDAVAFRSGERAARALTALGVGAALPTIATGLSDWDDTQGDARRIGVAHLASNSLGLLLQVASLSARRKHHHVRGALLGLAGLGAVTTGGYLGGHLVFVKGVGVDHEVPTVHDDGWHAACRATELVEGEPVGVTIGDARVALVRRFGQVYALAAVCSHAGGPLDRGSVRDDTLVCPWHGSAFCLADGTVERGPATTPQPVYETRLRGEQIEVRLVEAELALVHATV